MLKILATIDSELAETEWKALFLRHGWALRNRSGQPAGLRRGGLEIVLDGDGFTLLCGTNNQRDIAPKALLKILEQYAEHFTLEVFEEDGRLVNKIYF